MSISHAGTPPPLLPALHVPHYDRCCDSPLSLAIVPYHTHRLGLAPRLRRGCLGVGVRPLLRVWDTRSPGSRGQQEATAEEIEVRPAKHLAFQHLETVNVPLDWTGTPGEGHPGFDRRVVLIQSCGEATQGRVPEPCG